MANNTVAELIVKLSAQTVELSSGLKRAETEVRGFQTSMVSVAKSIGAALGGAFIAFAAFQNLKEAANAARDFGKAMSEVSTLLPKDADMKPLVEGAKEAAKAFGGAPQEQAKAYYQIISAGATTAASATNILTAANKLAVGGVTDVATAADGLTSTLNAYGMEASRSLEVTDAMFVAMRAGKTTIGELSRGIGVVAPIAAQTGVALDDLLAAVSAITKGGINTKIAMTGLRAILAAIAKPASEAVTIAGQLGIEFTAAGLKSKGLAGFLADVKEKTGGNTDALAKLFGGVEALIPVMALAGNAAKDYAQILSDMGRKAGETEEAFKKMTEDAAFKLNQLKAAFTVLSIEAGDKMLKVIVPVAEALVENMDKIVVAVELLSVAIASRLVTAFVLWNVQLVASIIQGLRATAVLAGYSSTATLAAVKIRAAGIAANIAAGQFGLLAGALRLLGGPIGALITGLSLAAAAWSIFGSSAEDGGDKAIEKIKKMVEEYGQVKAPHQLILDAIDAETAALEKERTTLQKMKQDLDANTIAAESMMAAMGDAGGVRGIEDMDRKLAEIAKKLKALEDQRQALEKKVAAVAEPKKEAAAGLSIVPPEVLAAQHKANLKIAQTQASEELAVLEDSYKKGLVSLEEYYAERGRVTQQAIRKEIDLLKKEAADKSTKPERRVEIGAEVSVLESGGRLEALRQMREKEKEALALARADEEASLAVSVAGWEKYGDDLKRQFDNGLIGISEYFAKRKKMIEEQARQEIAALEVSKIGATPEQVSKIDAEIVVRKVRLDASVVKEGVDESIAWNTLDAARLDSEQRLLAAKGKSIEADRIALRLDIESYRLSLLSSGVDVEEANRRIADLTNAKSREIEFNEKIRQFNIEQNDLAARKQEILDRLAVGEGNSVTAEAAIIALNNERIPRLQEIAELAERIAEATKDPAMKQQVDGLNASISQLGVETNTAGKDLAALKQGSQDALVNGFANYLSRGITEAENFNEAITNMARNFAQAMADMIAQMLAMAAVKALLGAFGVPFSGGGSAGDGGLASVAEWADGGGPIRGPGTETSDSIPAWLSKNEYVVRARAVKHYGVNVLEAINRMVLPRDAFRGVGVMPISAPRFSFATGGAVTGSGVSTVDSSLTVGLERGLLLRELETPAGQKVLVKMLEKNRRSVKGAIG